MPLRARPTFLDQHVRVFVVEAARNYAHEYEAHGDGPATCASIRSGPSPGRRA
jgi:hypothetical protein